MDYQESSICHSSLRFLCCAGPKSLFLKALKFMRKNLPFYFLLCGKPKENFLQTFPKQKVNIYTFAINKNFPDNFSALGRSMRAKQVISMMFQICSWIFFPFPFSFATTELWITIAKAARKITSRHFESLQIFSLSCATLKSAFVAMYKQKLI